MKEAFKKDRIIFLDTTEACDRYSAQASGGSIFIAMNPSVSACLGRKGSAYRNTLPYFTNESHKKLLRKSELVLAWIRDNASPAGSGSGFTRAELDNLIFCIRLAVHYCLYNIEVVSNAIEIHKPDAVSAYLNGRRATSSLYIEPREMYFGHIVKAVAAGMGIKFKGSSGNDAFSAAGLISYPLIYVNGLMKYAARLARFKGWQNNIHRMTAAGTGSPVFYTTKSYGMAELARKAGEDLIGKKFYLMRPAAIPFVNLPDILVKIFRPSSSFSYARLKKELGRIGKAMEKNREVFSYRNVYFGDIIARKLSDNIAPYISGQRLWADELVDFLDSVKAIAFISNGNRADDLTLAWLCRERNIKYIFVSHGSHRKPADEYEAIEWGEHGRALLSGLYSHLALQTPLAEGYLEAFPSSGSVIRTGPLIWGKPVDANAAKVAFRTIFGNRFDIDKTRVVIHAGTPKTPNALRLYVYETPDEYVQAICDLARVVEGTPDTALVVRFRPQRELRAEDLKRLVPFSERVVLSVDEPFAAVLGMADLLVSFSSTTIEEALQNRIPVLLYGGGGRYVHVPAFEVRPGGDWQSSAVYHVGETSGLSYAIGRILEESSGASGEEELFRPYIYEEASRTPLSSILK